VTSSDPLSVRAWVLRSAIAALMVFGVWHRVVALPVAPGPEVRAEEGRSEDQAGNEYRIGVGDLLTVSVWDQKDVSQDGVPVRPDGMISLPLVRDVRAQGLTCTQLADRLTELLQVYVTKPTVTVVVKEINSLTIYVLGQVKSSGALPLKSRVRLLQAISMAGGFTPYAHGDAMVVLRKNGTNEQRIPVNYSRIVSGRSPEQNILLQAGDTVIVP